MATETTADSPISDTTIVISHRTITSKLSFADTLVALESAIPPINPEYKQHLKAGRPADALAALQSLAPLNNFMLLDRDFGGLIQVHGIKGKNAIQCEIGNPYSASKMARYNLGAALYAPIRVAILEDDDGVVKFVFDKPTTTFGQFKHDGIDETAAEVENRLTQLLLFVGRWPSEWAVLTRPL